MTQETIAEQLAKELAVEYQYGMPQYENTAENLEIMVRRVIEVAIAEKDREIELLKIQIRLANRRAEDDARNRNKG